MKDWDSIFRAVLQLPEDKKVEMARLLKQEIEQARRHPKYFSAQVYAILRFIEGYRNIMPKEIICKADQIYEMITI